MVKAPFEEIGIKLLNAISRVTGFFFEPKEIERKAIVLEKAKDIKLEGEIGRDKKKREYLKERQLEEVTLENNLQAETKQITQIIEKGEAETGLNIPDVQKRGMVSLFHEAGRHQENRENITAKAIPHLKPDAKPEEVDPDWYANFFDKTKNVSDEEMQFFWAYLLAEEANKPGSFSRKTVEIVSTLTKEDAELFTQLCSFAVNPSDEKLLLIMDYTAKIYINNGIDFPALNHFNSMGLVTLNTVSGYKIQSLPETGSLPYFNEKLAFKLKSKTDYSLNVGQVMLSATGQELALICDAEEVPGFLEYLTEFYTKEGVELTIKPLQEEE